MNTCRKALLLKKLCIRFTCKIKLRKDALIGEHQTGEKVWYDGRYLFLCRGDFEFFHELGHWLYATEAERMTPNFGLGLDGKVCTEEAFFLAGYEERTKHDVSATIIGLYLADVCGVSLTELWRGYHGVPLPNVVQENLFYLFKHLSGEETERLMRVHRYLVEKGVAKTSTWFGGTLEETILRAKGVR